MNLSAAETCYFYEEPQVHFPEIIFLASQVPSSATNEVAISHVDYSGGFFSGDHILFIQP